MLGRPLPLEVREIYAVHDGIGMPAVVGGICGSSFLLSLEDARDEWESMSRELRAGTFKDSTPVQAVCPVEAVWWSEGWVPVTSDGAGNSFCVDLTPTASGVVGQVISFWHDDPLRKAHASGLAEFLDGFVEAAEWAHTIDRMNRMVHA